MYMRKKQYFSFLTVSKLLYETYFLTKYRLIRFYNHLSYLVAHKHINANRKRTVKLCKHKNH